MQKQQISSSFRFIFTHGICNKWYNYSMPDIFAQPSRTSSLERLGGLPAPAVNDSRSELLPEDSSIREKV